MKGGAKNHLTTLKNGLFIFKTVAIATKRIIKPKELMRRRLATRGATNIKSQNALPECCSAEAR